ncbi:carbohydrate esterase family 8 protein [Schizophyllum amplum]|uniref:pectinesterase n=1 Tax=Schizophyllum amplum TaxID=97359 RepID=A0A550CBF8_9AGAR|nr:carbohydrate esterase family 8 protein [Auriculariopsis ampla]
MVALAVLQLPVVLQRFAVLFTLLLPGVASLSPTYLACQVQKAANVSQLTGCPAGTILVSQDTSDPDASFTSVQEAVLAVAASDEPTIILIAEGEYNEVVNYTGTAPLTLLGQLPPTITSAAGPFANASATALNLVQIWSDAYVTGTGMDDADTAVLTIAPSRAGALIGSGPTGAPLQPLSGSADFRAYNIDFVNRAADYAISQALATDISYANASFYGCSFKSYQDTWYTGRNASTYVVDSVIFGQTDYLFGFGTAWFQNVILANRGCGGGIVAWKGTNETDAPGNRYGAYVANSTIMRSPDANDTTETDGLCYLGRPWNDLATTVFIDTYMDESINSEGWKPFNDDRPEILDTTYYAEYNSTGPGGDTSARVPPSHILDEEDVSEMDFTIEGVFTEHPDWIDFDYMY